MENDLADEKVPLLRNSSIPVFTDKCELKTRSKVCYGIGGIPFTLTVNAIGIYMTLFLLEVAMIRPIYASIIIFLGKAWEAVMNPVVGMSIDRFDNPRFGKLKPWLACATPFAVVLYFFLWYVPDMSERGKLIYYLVMYCTFQTALTCYHLPYVALTMLLSPEQKDRDSATAYRMLCEMFGTVLGGVIYAQLLALQMGDGSFTNPCANGNITDRPTVPPGERHPAAVAFMAGAGMVGILIVIFCIVVQLGTTEKRDIVEDEGARDPFCASLKQIFTHVPYVTSLMFFLCTILGLVCVMGNMTLFFIYSLDFIHFQYAIIVLLGTSLVFVPVWQYALLKIGKRKTTGIALLLMIPLLCSLLVLPGDPVAVYTMSAAIGTMFSALLLCPWSLAPDVMDDFTLATGSKKDALMVSFYVFANKLSVGITLGVSTLLLEVAGYETGACSQPESVGFMLRILVSVVPVTFMILALLFIWMYPITELRRSETRTRLAERRRNSQVALYRSRSNGVTRVPSTETLEEEPNRSPPEVKFTIAGNNESSPELSPT